MNTKAVRQRPQWLIWGGSLVGAVIVGGLLRMLLAPTPSTSQADFVPAEEAAQSSASPAPTLFESPMIGLSEQLQRATPADLVISTSSKDRLSVIATGRPDPFAPITRSLGHGRRKADSESSNTNASNTVPSRPAQPLPEALPTAPVSALPDLPPIPAAPPVALPPIPVATAPVTIPALPSSLPQTAAPSPQDPVSAIQLTGVVHVGNRIGVIVREGEGQTSQHLFVGDHLANGQIRIKSIDLSATEPLVILEYKGKEYPRIIG